MPITVDEGVPAGRNTPTRLPDKEYGEALSGLVIKCTDLLPIRRNQDGTFSVLLGLRDQEPMRDWWIFGGRQQWRMNAVDSLQQRIEVELGVRFETDRFSFIDCADLMWTTRAQEPVNEGCCVSTWVHGIILSADEIDSLRPNEEYRDLKWYAPEEIATGDFHDMVKHMTSLFIGRLKEAMDYMGHGA
jgi:hypothetical protein